MNEDSQRQFVDFNVVCCCRVTKYNAVCNMTLKDTSARPASPVPSQPCFLLLSQYITNHCVRADDDAQSTLGRRLATHIAHLRVGVRLTSCKRDSIQFVSFGSVISS
jgi:hypothetical protein